MPLGRTLAAALGLYVVAAMLVPVGTAFLKVVLFASTVVLTLGWGVRAARRTAGAGRSRT